MKGQIWAYPRDLKHNVYCKPISAFIKTYITVKMVPITGVPMHSYNLLQAFECVFCRNIPPPLLVGNLTNWGQVTHICINNLCQHWCRKWLGAWLAASHYLNQCWNIGNWTLRNKFQWNFDRNSNILIQENEFESVVCKMVAILSGPQCVKPWHYCGVTQKSNSMIKCVQVSWSQAIA